MCAIGFKVRIHIAHIYLGNLKAIFSWLFSAYQQIYSNLLKISFGSGQTIVTWHLFLEAAQIDSIKSVMILHSFGADSIKIKKGKAINHYRVHWRGTAFRCVSVQWLSQQHFRELRKSVNYNNRKVSMKKHPPKFLTGMLNSYFLMLFPNTVFNHLWQNHR